MNTQEFKNQIDSASRILIILPDTINSDSCASAGLLYRMLKVKNGKEVDIAASKRIPARFTELLEKSGINPESLVTEIKPISYIIKVDDAKEQIKVEWKKVGEEIDLILTPQSQEIDFSKIRFAKEGGIYDLVIVINSQKLNDLGTIYSEYKSNFDRFTIISVNKFDVKENFAKASLIDDEYSTTSEIIFQAFESLGYNPEKLDAEIAAEGIIGSTFGLHQINKPKSYSVVADLANKHSVDFASITTKYFYSFGKDDIKLRERILKNVKFDDSRKTVYSTLSNEDFSSLGLTSKMLEGCDYLPFNICKDYEYAFLVYAEGENAYGLVHANRSENKMDQILDLLNAHGDKLFGIATFKSSVEDGANKILSAIDGSLQKEETPTSQPESSAEAPKPDETPNESSAPQTSNESEAILPSKDQLSNVEEKPTAAEQVNSNEPNGSAAPVPQASPFTPATSYVVDNSAEPAKKSSFYSGDNKPFDESKS